MEINLKRNVTFDSSDIEIIYDDFVEQEDNEEVYDEEVKEEKRFDLSEEDFNREIDQSYDKGYSEGMINAIERFEAEHNESVKKINELSDLFKKEKNDLFEELQNQVINVAIAISEKVVRKELSEDNELLVNLVKKAFEKLKSSIKFTLYLSDKNKSYFKGLKLQLAKQKSASINYVVDEKLDEFDFYIESDQGNVYHILSDVYDQIKSLNKQ